MKSVFVAIFASIAVPATAQSSLGITGAEFRVGQTQDELGANRLEGSMAIDVAITDVHGFKGDLRFAGTASGGIGAVGAHLYMSPKMGQKYGLFAQLSDVDGRSMTWGTIGVEGMISLDWDTTLEAQAGMGLATEDSLDFIFAGAALSHAYSDALDATASIDLAEIDETSLRAISYEASLGVNYSPEGAPWGIYANISQAGLSGRDAHSGETRIGLGLTLTLGNSGGVSPSTRPFRAVDPVAPLLRRSLW